MFADRRKNTRTRVFQPARIIATSSDTAHHCIVDNLTINGACVTLAANTDVPPKFDLTFDNGHTFWSCRVIWRKRKRGTVGVIWKSVP